MNLTWQIKLSNTAKKQLKKIDNKIQKRIVTFLKTLSSKYPRAIGKPLKKNFIGLWRYRIGEYRIICDIQDDKITILILRIGHRSKVYKKDIRK